MVLLFADIFLVKRAFPAKFEEVRVAHPYVLYASGVIGILASAFGAYVTFRSQWTSLFSIGHWRLWLAVLCGGSIAAAVLIYAISGYVHRREAPRPTLTPAGGVEAHEVVKQADEAGLPPPPFFLWGNDGTHRPKATARARPAGRILSRRRATI